MTENSVIYVVSLYTETMSSHDQQLLYADRVAQIWAHRYRVSPMTGRVAGYLFVCEPAAQSIDELAAALMASRSAVAGAVRDLEARRMLQRVRPAGERADRVRMVFDDSRGFDPAPYREAAAIAREGLTLLSDTRSAQRALLENTASLNAFLAERLPLLLDEWRETQRPTTEEHCDQKGDRTYATPRDTPYPPSG
jgi:DNA-binding transcriptional regulator GbsR (MarR family)